ncbi:hypothetical protein CCR75_002102 [Bremia lactucae]|uniref:Uncharacterized protein n=1 Tax=Bremia lactucae TaxID=4779 RepID=A0A976IFT6_BRELC|nr:hypothetical protein CCR75_006264 [Bremia lactucae]TDH69908.1 hypothetical protein CCR75_002102 [Bremia lactucae]
MMPQQFKYGAVAGDSKEVSFSLSKADWGVYKPQIGFGLHRIVKDSMYVVAIEPDMQCNVYYGAIINPLCAAITINLSGAHGRYH